VDEVTGLRNALRAALALAVRLRGTVPGIRPCA